jgi:hypothetical protein
MQLYALFASTLWVAAAAAQPLTYPVGKLVLVVQALSPHDGIAKSKHPERAFRGGCLRRRACFRNLRENLLHDADADTQSQTSNKTATDGARH